MALTVQRQVVLIELAREFASRLPNRRVERRGRSGNAHETGIPKACIGRVASYLRAGCTEQQFRRFRELLPQLDGFDTQNATNPLQYYGALADELRSLPGIVSVEEWAFLVGWTHRMMAEEHGN